LKSESNDASLKMAADFLLAEYHTMENHLWKNEELGDRRVNIFLTVASAVMAASASLMAGEDFFTVTGTLNPKLFWIIFFSLTAVFLFGLLTLSRIIRRNLETDSCKMALDRIRLYFLRLNPNIFPYLPFDPHKKIPQRRAHLLAFGSGGLVQTIVFINCLLLAAAGGLIAIAGSAFVAVHAGAPAARI
jgi:Ca2+/Na+ antiporter